MKRPLLYDPIKHLREKGVTIRKGLSQDGKTEFEFEFRSGQYWTPHRVLAISKLVEQSRPLIMMQLDVERCMPPCSMESLIAKDFIRIQSVNTKNGYLITERGK